MRKSKLEEQNRVGKGCGDSYILVQRPLDNPSLAAGGMGSA